VSLPVVQNNGTSELSLFPYTDFLDKEFVYNTTSKQFEKNTVSSVAKYRPEIWHSLIVPNTGNSGEDSREISQFFNKTHDFYLKRGVYTSSAPDPYVFYYDGKGEELSAKLSSWKLYELGRSLSEDLVYNRYRQTLADSVYSLYQQFSAEELTTSGSVSASDVLSASGVDLVSNYLSSQSSVYGTSALSYLSGSSFSTATDILSKKVIDALVKPFYLVFNETFIGNILKYVHNAGRYNSGTNVNVDIPATLVTKQDVFYTKTKKEVNTFLESQIDTLVSGGLSRNVALLESYNAPAAVAAVVGSESETIVDNTYTNYFFGKMGSSITKAEQCSIVRGSTLAVESNRGYNVNNVQPDIDTLSPEGAKCAIGTGLNTSAYWGGNSPLNLDFTSGDGTLKMMTLRNNRYVRFTKPAFDMAGSRELSA